MAFLNTNFRKTQYVAALRTTAQVGSTDAFIQFSLSQMPPPPTGEAQLMYRLHLVGKPTYPIRLIGSFSYSGNYLAATLIYSQTSLGAMSMTASVIGIFHWLIGSR